ncbi:syntaxin-61 isoform X2 [Argentina anserina]|uniref:syntaxin-61 isoform X2 n=1 Tax=Argentina anserina TaxID=57926 RepID=UPI00217692E6|nr:syntaxin-61 isoform X2 [Potentilla anserina]
MVKIKYNSRRSCLLCFHKLSGRKVEELDKAISVAAVDTKRFGIDEAELEKRRRWTSNARAQVSSVKRAVKAGKESTGTSAAGMRRELMRLADSQETERSNQYAAHHNDDFITSESDRQLLLIKQQDEELDELSASVERIGGVGLTIHEELLAQDKIVEELGMEMDSTSNRLDFVQKKVATVMKKAGIKGQMMMILFLVVLFIILFVLVFLT